MSERRGRSNDCCRPTVVAELLSLVAPVLTFTVDDPTVVGVPNDTGQ